MDSSDNNNLSEHVSLEDKVLLMATVATGLEQVAREELISKCPTSIELFQLPNLNKHQQQQGRVFFKLQSDASLDFLKDMWSLEKLYIVGHFKQLESLSLEQQQQKEKSEEYQGSSSNHDQQVDNDRKRDLTRMRNELFSVDEKHNYDRALQLCHRFLSRTNPLITDMNRVTFRVTARRGGIHRFGSMELACECADGIVDLYPDWKPDLSNYDVEVLVYVHFDLCIVAFTAVDESLSLQRFESSSTSEANDDIVNADAAKMDVGTLANDEPKKNKKKNSKLQLTALSLRPSIAYAMVHLANVQGGDVVLDLCCGSGMIAAVTNEVHTIGNYHFIAGDYAPTVLEKASFNNSQSETRSTTDFVYWSFTHLPLRDNSVDVIISNLPFGKKVGTRDLNKKIYPPMMRELARVLKSGNGRAILLSTEKGLMHSGVKQNQALIKLESRITINMGGMDVFLYVIMKKSEKVQKKHRGRSTRKRRKVNPNSKMEEKDSVTEETNHSGGQDDTEHQSPV